MAYAPPHSNSSPLGTSSATATFDQTTESSQHSTSTEVKEKGDSIVKSFNQLLTDAHNFSQAQQDLHAQERSLWKQERKNWQHERKQFSERIRELEATVATFITGRTTASTWGQHAGMPAGSSTSAAAGQPGQAEQQPSNERAVWIGSKSVTTRVFPDDVPFQPTNRLRRHSIEGNQPLAAGKKSVEFDSAAVSNLSRHESLSGVSGESVHPDYSDINFKPSALPSELRRAVEKVEAQGLQDKTGLELDGTFDSKPQAVIRPKLLDIPTANMQSEELYSVDAGHTPLVRLMGSDSAGGDRTPMPPTHSQQPVESHSSHSPVRAVRPPNERQDSYFANAQIDGSGSSEDRALKEPLGVSADGGAADNEFLDKVNEKLERQLSQQLDNAKLSPPAEKGHRRGVSEDSDGGPKLRLKPSINFGAPFGQSEPRRM